MITTKKDSKAVGGKTMARACDSCLHKRARWYCTADDAFLCRGCDTSVHSANQLASKHERVEIKPIASATLRENSAPAWHRGFTRKARTPRHAKPVQPPKEEEREEEEKIVNSLPLVPEIGSEENLPDENEEQLQYLVPVFDPFIAEPCNASNEVLQTSAVKANDKAEVNVLLTDNGHDNEGYGLNNFHGLSDMDLEEFAGDVERLLGTGLDDDSCGIEGLGLLDCKEEDAMDSCSEGRRVKKVKDENVEAFEACQLDETIDWNFDYQSPEEEVEEKGEAAVETAAMNGGCKEAEVKRKIVLRLNHEAVISAWASQGSPWTTGVRPEFNPDDCWPDFMGWWPRGYPHPCGRVRSGDGGREARVSRYREKRRRRLFSKKIRYQVRKLNAENRPRMKGRFVKRESFVAGPPAFPYLMVNK